MFLVFSFTLVTITISTAPQYFQPRHAVHFFAHLRFFHNFSFLFSLSPFPYFVLLESSRNKKIILETEHIENDSASAESHFATQTFWKSFDFMTEKI